MRPGDSEVLLRRAARVLDIVAVVGVENDSLRI